MNRLDAFAPEWSTLNALLDQALARPASAGAAWLDALVGEPAAHREALRALLGHRAKVEVDDFLGALPLLGPGWGVPSAHGPRAGSLVGGYRLVRQIGRGGMCTVWLAERVDEGRSGPAPDASRAQVALKIPHAGGGGDSAERFARERRILATFEHAHIARLYDAGLDPNGRPFLALEFVDGEPIDTHCARRALPLRARLELLLQVMAAVSHVHSKRVVHCDLKPGNILVDAHGQVKLLDFGIARPIDREHGRRSAPIEIAGRALTPDYASPEQIRGEPAGTTSDVYSLGVVAFELLVGARPYRLQRGSAAEIEKAIETALPLRASEAATVPAVRQALRGDLDAILRKALNKVGMERYQSVDAFARDIERWLARQPGQARLDDRQDRRAKFVRRRLFGLPMGAAFGVSAAVGGWRRPAREARAQAARGRAERIGEPALHVGR